ncbi:hypothetical protein OTB19_35080 [Streptomyces sp. H27-H5]|nr:hypothetical protein [Streptomyces sp. H27-H5]MCY0962082.1 hypothetical protein [Streptomyces sp. H27-H5]
MATLEEREVWFLTGSQSLYGDETLRQVARQSQQIAETLQGDPGIPVRIVWKPVLTDAEAIRRICLEANSDDACIGLIAWMHTFSPAKMWIAGLDALGKPLLHLHTQANVALPWSSIDMDFMNLNQAAHGDREFGYIQTRIGVTRKTITGHVSDPSVAARIASWVRAAAGRAEMRGLRLARFGDNMRDVAVTEGDKVEAQLRFGASVNTYGVNDLVEVVDDTLEADVTELVKEYEDTYRVAPELRPGGDRHASLRYAARIELGMRAFLTAGGFRAFTTNFEDLGGLRQLPGLAVQRLMADGYGFGGEGDWKTSVLLRTLKVMSQGLPGGVSFMEVASAGTSLTRTTNSARSSSGGSCNRAPRMPCPISVTGSPLSAPSRTPDPRASRRCSGPPVPLPSAPPWKAGTSPGPGAVPSVRTAARRCPGPVRGGTSPDRSRAAPSRPAGAVGDRLPPVRRCGTPGRRWRRDRWRRSARSARASPVPGGRRPR